MRRSEHGFRITDKRRPDRYRSLARLLLAGNARVPIGEAASRIALPRPYVQFVEGLKTKAVRCVDEIEQMSFQGRRARRLGILAFPSAGEDDALDADESKRATGERLVDESFGLIGVQRRVTQASWEHEMYAHGPEIRSADARRRPHPVTG